MKLPSASRTKTASQPKARPSIEVIIDAPERPKPHQDAKVWSKEAVKNAKHKAHVFIELHDARRAAECFADFPLLDALSHLYRLADAYRHESDFVRADVVLLAAEHLRPKEHGAPSPTAEHWHQFKKPAPKIKRARPAEILTAEIKVQIGVTILRP